MRRVVSAKARGARGAGWARKARLSIKSIVARRTSRAPVSLGAVISPCWLLGILGSYRTILRIWADRAALSVWDDGVGTVGGVLADHLVAHDGSTVADADLARLWFPYILIVVQLSI